MPNTGKPSKDCHLCRKRRVKCDLGRPSCQRCIKYGAECPGYRNEQDVVFRAADPSARRTKQKKAAVRGSRGGRESQDRASISVLDINVNSNGGPSAHPSPSIGSTDIVGAAFDNHGDARVMPRLLSTPPSPSPSLKDPWTLHSIPLLLTCYSTVSVLSDVYRKVAVGDDPLVLATHLWARTYLANRFHAPMDRRETNMYLGKTLRSVAAAVQDRELSTSDTTIMAVWLLGMYEIQIGGLNKQSGPVSAWHVHSDGLVSLLRARGVGQLRTKRGRRIFWSAFTIVQTNSIISNNECPPETKIWLDTIEDIGDLDDALVLQVSKYIYRACRLISAMTRVCVKGLHEEACASYVDMVQETDAVELEMMNWMALASPEQLDTSAVVHYFWNSWRSARLKLQHRLIQVSNLVEFGPVAAPVDGTFLRKRREMSYNIIAATAQDIVDAAPISLGGRSGEFTNDPHAAWFEGMRQIWPLTNVYIFRTVPKELRLTARNALAAIGRDRGILQALKSQPGETTFVPEATMGIPVDESIEGFDRFTFAGVEGTPTGGVPDSPLPSYQIG